MPKNALYSIGKVTSVINASACGVIERAREQVGMGKVYAGMNGILGALREELIDTSKNQGSDSAVEDDAKRCFGSVVTN